MAIKEGEHLLDNGEATLSSSELDDVLSSAEFQDGDAEERSLERYGVWVKVKPENVGAAADGPDVFGLSDLDGGENSELTPEEEELLGKLEDEPMDTGEFEGLEADLEELGRSIDTGDLSPGAGLEADEEEISVEDLDVDLEELTLEASPGNGSAPDNSFPDLDLSEGDSELESLDELSADQEIEVPLSENAAVEEHFAGLGGVSGGGPPKSSADILEKIEADLKQIKNEIQTLKKELTAFGRVGGGQLEVQPAPEGPPGFFNQEEDETIALTGDELDNILNTADVTEETAEPVEEELEEELSELPEEAMSLDLEDAGQPSGLEEVSEEGEDVLELGSLDLEDEQASDGLDEIEIDIGGGEGNLDLEDFGGNAEAADLDLEALTLEAPGGVPGIDAEELILEDLPEASEADEELALEPVEGAEMEIAELTLPDGLEDAGMDALELEELDGAGQIDDLFQDAAAEPAGIPRGEPLEELALSVEDLELEATDIGEVGNVADAEEPDQQLDAPLGEEVLDLEELPEMPEEAGAEMLSLDSEALDAPIEGLEALEGLEAAEDFAGVVDEIEEMEAVDELAGQSHPSAGAGGFMSPDLKKDVSSVLTYLDQLLEALPDDKIREFARSEYFGIYKRLFDELGLGA